MADADKDRPAIADWQQLAEKEGRGRSIDQLDWQTPRELR